jgi:hypothetical protein
MATNRGEQPGIVGPDSFPIRHPTNPNQQVGRMVNPPRFLEIGGLDGPSKWHKDYNTSSQDEQMNRMTLERGGPTGVKAAHDTSERKAAKSAD